MADSQAKLLPCPDCGGQVSRRAKSCPHCGCPIELPAPAPRLRAWRTKIVGVTQKNRDGSDRQGILRGCQVGDALAIARDPGNPHDRNAIRVLNRAGSQLGFVAADLAADLAPILDREGAVYGHVLQITGGVPGKPTRGANILIVFAQPGVPVEDVRDFITSEFRDKGGRPAGGTRPSGPSASVRVGRVAVRVGRAIASWFVGLPEWARFAAYGLAAGVALIVLMFLIRSALR